MFFDATAQQNFAGLDCSDVVLSEPGSDHLHVMAEEVGRVMELAFGRTWERRPRHPQLPRTGVLMKRQFFKDEILTGTESADQPELAEEMSDRRDQGRNHIGKVRIELCTKSFILQLYDVLARHSL